MKIGVCDGNLCQSKDTVEFIKENFCNGKECDVVTYIPNELEFDIEDGVFNCDIMIIEVELKNDVLSGIDIARRINAQRPDCQIIYMSNKVEYATNIYDTNHCYFVVKKDMKTILPKAIIKAIKIISEKQAENEYLKIIHNSHNMVIKIKDIIYIERDGRRINVVTGDGNFSVYESLSKVQERLTERFIRCHTGFIVNMDYVAYRTKDKLILITDKILPIGRAYISDIKKFR